MKFTNTITISRRPAEVFAFLADFENVPPWNYAISETWKIADGPVGVGSRYRQTRTLPSQSEEAFEVTEFEPDRRLSIRGILGPFHSEVAYVLEPTRNSTTLTNAMNLRPSGPLRLVAPIAASRVKTAVELWIKVADEAAPESPLISNGLRWLRAVIDGLDRRSGLRRHAPHRRHPQRLLAARCRRQVEVSDGARRWECGPARPPKLASSANPSAATAAYYG